MVPLNKLHLENSCRSFRVCTAMLVAFPLLAANAYGSEIVDMPSNYQCAVEVIIIAQNNAANEPITTPNPTAIEDETQLQPKFRKGILTDDEAEVEGRRSAIYGIITPRDPN